MGFSPSSRFDGSSEIFGTGKFLPDNQSAGMRSVLKPVVSGKRSLWKSRYVFRGTMYMIGMTDDAVSCNTRLTSPSLTKIKIIQLAQM